MKKLVIFDLDGTLLNTITDLGEACNYALAQMGYPTHSTAALTNMVGNGITKLIERALPEDARTTRIIEAMRAKFLECYEVHLCDNTVPYPGIPELLTRLREMNVAIAVASNKYQGGVEKLIRHFFGNLDWAAVEGHRTGMPTKPDPSVVFSILSQHPTPKADVLYVGDSGVDMETARRACVTSCGVTWGFRTRHELVEKHADYIVSTAEDILPLLDVSR